MSKKNAAEANYILEEIERLSFTGFQNDQYVRDHCEILNHGCYHVTSKPASD